MILTVVSVFGSIYAKKYRIFLSALVGAIYAMLIFFESFNFAYSIFFKLIVGFILCLIAYGKNDILKSTVLFFIISFCVAGAVMGVFYITKNPSYMMSNGVPYIDISVNILISATILCYVVLCGVFKGLGKNKVMPNSTKEIYINIMEKKVKVCAFIDSGNVLFDNITGKPIIIVESSEIERILPKKLRFLSLNNPIDIIYASSLVENDLKLRIVNYKALGLENGMMVVLTPKSIEEKDGKKINAIIGISPKKINIAGCTAIMGV